MIYDSLCRAEKHKLVSFKQLFNVLQVPLAENPSYPETHSQQ